MIVHRIPAGSLAAASAALDAIGTDADDLVVIHPDRHVRIVGQDGALEDAAALFAGAVAVGAATGAEPFVLALCGPAKALQSLLHAVGSLAGSDSERLIAAVDAGGHDVVLDSASQFFAVLDGTGTDVVVAGGRVFAGGEQPQVVIDPTAGGARIAAVERDLADEGGRDLVRLLRYEARATKSSEHPGRSALAAADIVVAPFWTVDFCRTVVRAAEAAGIWASDPDDPVPGAEVSLLSISPRLVALIDEDARARVWPELREHWPEVAVTGIADAFVIRYEAGGSVDRLPLHHDVAQVSASVRLNEGYEGGALEFPRQTWDNRDVAVGDIVAWPSLVTHPHRCAPVTRGVKYGLTVWFEIPGN